MLCLVMLGSSVRLRIVSNQKGALKTRRTYARRKRHRVGDIGGAVRSDFVKRTASALPSHLSKRLTILTIAVKSIS